MIQCWTCLDSEVRLTIRRDGSADAECLDCGGTWMVTKQEVKRTLQQVQEEDDDEGPDS